MFIVTNPNICLHNIDVSSTHRLTSSEWRPLDVTAVKYANVRTCPAPLVLGLGS